jgi:hypothetical protein
MKWYYIKEASQIVGKTERTLRTYLKKWKEQNPLEIKHKNIYKYEINEYNNKKLLVSDVFLMTYFDVQLPTPETTLEKEVGNDYQGDRKEAQEERPKEDLRTYIDFEDRLSKREALLRQHYEKQLEDITRAKQESIDILKEQNQNLNYNLNKVLEQYQMAQLTIKNLTEPQKESYQIEDVAQETSIEYDSEPEVKNDIEEIIQEQQKQEVKITPTKDYLESYQEKLKSEVKSTSFAEWLKSRGSKNDEI